MGLLQVEKLSVLLLASAGHPEQKRWASQPGLSVPGMAPILGGAHWHRSGARGHGNGSSVVLRYKCSGYLGRLDNLALTGVCAGCGVSGSGQPSPSLSCSCRCREYVSAEELCDAQCLARAPQITLAWGPSRKLILSIKGKAGDSTQRVSPVG